MENKTRKLVTLRKINAIILMEGYDQIALALIDGWSVIIKKDEFQVNDKCQLVAKELKKLILDYEVVS